jgi:NAD(P)-dependent dehydrogenase (short-subunit alcohol dehydrogenase family)
MAGAGQCRRFVGRVAIVTGGASGIGAAAARRLATEGASVAVADLNLDGAESVAKEIVAEGGVAAAYHFDQGDEASCHVLVAGVREAFGGVDHLHNCAAAVAHDFIGRDLDVETTDIDVWDETMRINARGYFVMCRAVIPSMLERGAGSIVNTSSSASLFAEPVRVAYGASKAAVNSLTRHVAVRYGKQGIRCNALAPGTTITDTLRAAVGQAFLDEFLTHLPTARHGMPEDQAAVVAFLLSDDSAYINGQTISVDGGFGIVLDGV